MKDLCVVLRALRALSAESSVTSRSLCDLYNILMPA
jgi:hypothetical protein